MTRSVVVFEDHSLDNFRPLAKSVPVYEIRQGMFNLRERVELTQKDLGETAFQGTLLCRDILGPLHTTDLWHINPATLTLSQDESDRFLWVNGRCKADFSEIRRLLAGDSEKTGFVCTDEHGLVAADLSKRESMILWNSWNNWRLQLSEKSNDCPRWDVQGLLKETPSAALKVPALGYIWDIVPSTAQQISQDLKFLVTGKSFSRSPFGVFPADDNPDAFWLRETTLLQASSSPEMSTRFKEDGENIWFGENVHLADSVAFDTTNGPIILDRDVTVMPHCFLEGPLYVGCGSRIKAGATIYGESSFGIGNRLAGEIGESTFADFANKQHDGFIGHAVLGSWVNLGAMTTCSDLKNNYGIVRVDLGSGVVDTGQKFVGLMMGDHAKTAIGTLFNTGTCVGFASNVFGGEMPPKFIRDFSWGGLPESPPYDVEKAIDTALVVMSRRGCRLSEEGKNLMRRLS